MNGRECCFSRLNSIPAVRGGYTYSLGRLDFNVAQRGVILCKSTAVEFSRVHKWNQRTRMKLSASQRHKILPLWLMPNRQRTTAHYSLCTLHRLLSRRLVVQALPQPPLHLCHAHPFAH